MPQQPISAKDLDWSEIEKQGGRITPLSAQDLDWGAIKGIQDNPLVPLTAQQLDWSHIKGTPPAAPSTPQPEENDQWVGVRKGFTNNMYSMQKILTRAHKRTISPFTNLDEMINAKSGEEWWNAAKAKSLKDDIEMAKDMEEIDKLKAQYPNPKTFSGILLQVGTQAGLSAAEILAATFLFRSPTIAMPLLGALEGEAEEGMTGLVKGAVSQYIFAKIFKATNVLPYLLSIPTNAAISGGLAAVDRISTRGGIDELTDDDKKYIAAEALVGAIMDPAMRLVSGQRYKPPTYAQFRRQLGSAGFKDTFINQAWLHQLYRDRQIEAELAARERNKAKDEAAAKGLGVAGVEKELTPLLDRLDELQAAKRAAIPSEVLAEGDFTHKAFVREGFTKAETPDYVKDPTVHYAVIDRALSDVVLKTQGIQGDIQLYPNSKMGLHEAISTAQTNPTGGRVIRVKDVDVDSNYVAKGILPGNIDKSVYGTKLLKYPTTGEFKYDTKIGPPELQGPPEKLGPDMELFYDDSPPKPKPAVKVKTVKKVEPAAEPKAQGPKVGVDYFKQYKKPIGPPTELDYRIDRLHKFEKIVKLKNESWTDEDWKAFEKWNETGVIPEFAKKGTPKKEPAKEVAKGEEAPPPISDDPLTPEEDMMLTRMKVPHSEREAAEPGDNAKLRKRIYDWLMEGEDVTSSRPSHKELRSTIIDSGKVTAEEGSLNSQLLDVVAWFAHRYPRIFKKIREVSFVSKDGMFNPEDEGEFFRNGEIRILKDSDPLKVAWLLGHEVRHAADYFRLGATKYNALFSLNDQDVIGFREYVAQPGEVRADRSATDVASRFLPHIKGQKIPLVGVMVRTLRRGYAISHPGKNDVWESMYSNEARPFASKPYPEDQPEQELQGPPKELAGNKKILDVTMGHRGMQKEVSERFGISGPITSMDIRPVMGNGMKPDVVADSRNMPFPNASFDTVLFDPPFSFHNKNSVGSKDYNRFYTTYGLDLYSSREELGSYIRDTFKEISRVLKPGGTVLLKWSESRIKLDFPLSLAGDLQEVRRWNRPSKHTGTETGTDTWYVWLTSPAKEAAPITGKSPAEMALEQTTPGIKPKFFEPNKSVVDGVKYDFSSYKRADLEKFIAGKSDELMKIGDAIDSAEGDRILELQKEYNAVEAELKAARDKLVDYRLKDISAVETQRKVAMAQRGEDDVTNLLDDPAFDEVAIHAEQERLSKDPDKTIISGNPEYARKKAEQTRIEIEARSIPKEDIRKGAKPAYELTDGTKIVANTISDLNAKLFQLDPLQYIGATLGWYHEGAKTFIPEHMLSNAELPTSQVAKKRVAHLADIINKLKDESGSISFRPSANFSPEKMAEYAQLKERAKIIEREARKSKMSVDDYLRSNGLSDEAIMKYRALMMTAIQTGEVFKKPSLHQQKLVHVMAKELWGDDWKKRLDETKKSIGLIDDKGNPLSMSGKEFTWDQAALLKAKLDTEYEAQFGESSSESAIKKLLENDYVSTKTFAKSWMEANTFKEQVGLGLRAVGRAAHSPEIPLLKDPVGAGIWDVFNKADLNIQRANEYAFSKKALNMDEFVDSVPKNSQEAKVVAGLLEGKIDPTTVSPDMRRLFEINKKYYQWAHDLAVKELTRGPIEEGLIRKLVELNWDSIKYTPHEKIDKVKMVISQMNKEFRLATGKNISKGGMLAIELLRHKEQYYMPHVFDKQGLLQQALESVKIMEAADNPNHKQIAEYKRFIEELQSDKLITYGEIPSRLRFPHFEKRIGAVGYIPDARVAFEHYHYGLLRKIYLEPALQKARVLHEQLPSELRPFSKKFIFDIMGWDKKQWTPLANFIKNYEWIRTLGFNPRSAMTNLIGGTINTVSEGVADPEAFVKGFARAVTPEGYRDFRSTGTIRGEIPNFQLEEVHHIRKLSDKLRFYSGLLFNAAEIANRNLAYQMGKVKGEKLGLQGDDLFYYAMDFMHRTQFRYGKLGMPMAMRGWGGVLFQFGSYPIKQWELIMKQVREAKDSPSLGNILRPIAQLSMQALLPGLAAKVGYDISTAAGFGVDWSDMYEAFKYAKEGDWENAYRYWELATSQGNGIFPNLPPLGPAANAIVKISTTRDSKMWELVRQLEFVQAEKVRDFYFGIKYQQNGRYPVFKYDNPSIFGQPIEKKYDLSLPDLYKKFMFLKPMAETEAQKELFNRNLLRGEMNDIIVKFHKAIVDGDKDEMNRILSKYPMITVPLLTPNNINEQLIRSHQKLLHTPMERDIINQYLISPRGLRERSLEGGTGGDNK